VTGNELLRIGKARMLTELDTFVRVVEAGSFSAAAASSASPPRR